MFVLGVFSVLLALQVAIAENSPFVKIPQGELKGKYISTRNGRTISGFLGIPYAAPPLGDLRFKSPAPAKGWSGIRDATKYGNQCPQKKAVGRVKDMTNTYGDEDCLVLNVFTPKVSSNSYLPVMVFIHGGGFFVGSSEVFMGPEYLLDKDIVLVAMNYRLGALGFLSTEDDVAPGNYGLKDQTAALLWVRDNIKHFGGNPDLVTIFGESAGSLSVSLHMLSPLSKGLFHAAICQSGTFPSPLATVRPGLAKKYSKLVAERVGCSGDSSDSIIACLRNIPVSKLTNFISDNSDMGMAGPLMFRPIVEGKQKDAFLTEYSSMKTTSIPWMLGFNSEEGAMRVSALTKDGLEKGLQNVNQNIENILEVSLFLSGSAESPKEIIQKIREFYFGHKEINKDVVKSLVDVYTDYFYLHPIVKALDRHKGPAYYYYFNFKGENTFSVDFGNTIDDFGVCHGDELLYLSPVEVFFPNRTVSDDELKMSQQMVELWTNFAKYGTPTPKRLFTFWEPVTSSDLEYLHISNDGFKIGKNLLKQRADFWSSLPIIQEQQSSKPKHEKTEL